jgi:hypothetical protein
MIMSIHQTGTPKGDIAPADATKTWASQETPVLSFRVDGGAPVTSELVGFHTRRAHDLRSQALAQWTDQVAQWLRRTLGSGATAAAIANASSHKTCGCGA